MRGNVIAVPLALALATRAAKVIRSKTVISTSLVWPCVVL